MNTFILKRRIRKMTGAFSRTKHFLEYREIHRVLILFEPQNLLETESFAKSLLFAGKEVVAYAFDENKKNRYPNLMEGFHVWNSDQMSILGIPLEQDMAAFCSFQPDTLIDLTRSDQPVMEYLSLRTNADYRISFKTAHIELDDLVIECKPEQDFSFLVSQLHFYVKSLRTK